jgi:hypothetical protein
MVVDENVTTPFCGLASVPQLGAKYDNNYGLLRFEQNNSALLSHWQDQATTKKSHCCLVTLKPCQMFK